MSCSQALPRPCDADSSPIVSVDVVFRPSPMMSSSRHHPLLSSLIVTSILRCTTHQLQRRMLSGLIDWVTVHKPKERLSTSLTVITEAKKETIRTPTVVWGLVPRSSANQGLREFSRSSGGIRESSPCPDLQPTLNFNDLMRIM